MIFEIEISEMGICGCVKNRIRFSNPKVFYITTKNVCWKSYCANSFFFFF